MKAFITRYLEQQKKTIDTIDADKISAIISIFKRTLDEDRQLFVFGNGGSAASATHFVTDLGKGASDKAHKRFRCFSLNDNTGWLTALGNDYSYEDVFVRQLMNLAKPGDVMFTMSVSGNSPNLVKAVEWCKQNKVHVIALVGGKKGKLAQLADTCVVINDLHYGRVEDAHMNICHIIAFAFIENESLQGQD
ncbi:SIS domain-containing protein [Fulvivirgaceae bacterium PWU4]|uniref:SIS domain-containing protein n=1 Tax=Chryseosolibacter histidini TaxID=2782349 RepID=A0AAP2GHN2_9BACT|nr:SIS domain-containing protein [Chryseosolibacter histidini]MBT1696216.1 SIS domain-containing protein [Chryseosolibacter histidini]